MKFCHWPKTISCNERKCPLLCYYPKCFLPFEQQVLKLNFVSSLLWTLELCGGAIHQCAALCQLPFSGTASKPLAFRLSKLWQSAELTVFHFESGIQVLSIINAKFYWHSVHFSVTPNVHFPTAELQKFVYHIELLGIWYKTSVILLMVFNKLHIIPFIHKTSSSIWYKIFYQSYHSFKYWIQKGWTH